MIDSTTFSSHSALLNEGAVHMTRVLADGDSLGFADAMSRLQNSEEFRRFFGGLLRASPFDAFRFETPPVTFALAERPFEFVLVRDASLARGASPAAFAEHFATTDAAVTGFANLGRDAYMLVPTPQGANEVYAHIGAFMRGAPESQVDALWQRVGEAMTLRLNDRPVWLNTAGGGVPWLHVRLDTRPKYYCFKPYTRP